jgi:hypothetical protein
MKGIRGASAWFFKEIRTSIEFLRKTKYMVTIATSFPQASVAMDQMLTR